MFKISTTKVVKHINPNVAKHQYNYGCFVLPNGPFFIFIPPSSIRLIEYIKNEYFLMFSKYLSLITELSDSFDSLNLPEITEYMYDNKKGP